MGAPGALGRCGRRWFGDLVGNDYPDQDSAEQAAVAELQRHRRRLLVPSNEVGGIVRTEPVIFRSADGAIQLEVVRVFSTAVQLQFRVIARATSSEPRRAPLALSMGTGDDVLWVGVQLPDGRRATNAGVMLPGEDVEPDVPVLARTEAHGHATVASISYLLTPLPPPGPLTVVLAWLALGIQECTAVINGDDLAAAAASVVALWPLPAQEDSFRRHQTQPQPPPGSWFAVNPPAGSPAD